MRNLTCFRISVVTVAAMFITTLVVAEGPELVRRDVHFRAGQGATITAVKWRPGGTGGGVANVASLPFPRPRLIGFSPRVAVTTSDKRDISGNDLATEHILDSSYEGSPLNGSPDTNFVIGFMDSGSDVELFAGSGAETLGVTGSMLTENTLEIGGVGGSVSANITFPFGIYAAGLSNIDGNGILDTNALKGHSNVSALAAPPIGCGDGEVVSAIIGRTFMTFYNTVIWVDSPQSVTIGEQTSTSPDVWILEKFEDLPQISNDPELTRAISIEFGAFTIATTASYWGDPFDLDVPFVPTLLSFLPGSIPFGGAFFATVLAVEGEPGPTNPAQELRMMVDTGAQASIISPAVAASLSLPINPDFFVEVCGIGGFTEEVPGYYIDFIKINALGGAFEFSKAPFIVVDLGSPEGGSLDGVLGMNFFWNRNIIFEPALLSSGFLTVSDVIPFAHADFDVDFDVDAADVRFFISCTTGPGVALVSPECDFLDAEADGGVDLKDFARVQMCFSGEGVDAEPNCGN